MKQQFKDRELLERILTLIEKGSSNTNAPQADLYDNKALMKLLGVSDSYLRKLRDNGHLGFSRHGDKYWYTRKDVEQFLKKYHFEAFATGDVLPEQKGKIYG